MTGWIELWARGAQLFQAISGPGLTILLEVTVKGTILMLFAAALALVLRRASAASRHLWSGPSRCVRCWLCQCLRWRFQRGKFRSFHRLDLESRVRR